MSKKILKLFNFSAEIPKFMTSKPFIRIIGGRNAASEIPWQVSIRVGTHQVMISSFIFENMNLQMWFS